MLFAATQHQDDNFTKSDVCVLKPSYTGMFYNSMGPNPWVVTLSSNGIDYRRFGETYF
jgi:hypothetical protein